MAPAAPDIGRLSAHLTVPVLAQHVDSDLPGARTGRLIVEAVRAAGASGSLVNHSEHPISDEEVGRVVARLGAAGLEAVVCARNVDEARRLARYQPGFLAIEPPELIGGTISVATARPELVAGTVDAVRTVAPSTRVLCGAGVHDREDVWAALRLGSSGVLVASAVTQAADPKRAVAELLDGFWEVAGR